MLNDYTLANDLDRQFGDVPVGLRKILPSMIHRFCTHPRGQFTLDHLNARYHEQPQPVGRLLGRNGSNVTDVLGLKRPLTSASPLPLPWWAGRLRDPRLA